MKKIQITALLLVLTSAMITGCANETNVSSAKTIDTPVKEKNTSTSPANVANQEKPATDGNRVVSDANSISVLVNKHNALPDNYAPTDLVDPNVPFTFKEKNEKRKMRKEAAKALENLFAGAKKDGVLLAGVSAYRSEATQKVLFNNYAQKDGMEKAMLYSAVPGNSEHETGLAIDVSGASGKCAAEDCFGGTKEANWLEKHAWEYGFIVRYPKGKEAITGYQYEPWHIRYVGTEIAKEIQDKGLTLEEYIQSTSKSKM
jgi:zinc D-Ala-D-Ala carboxypeptidase